VAKQGIMEFTQQVITSAKWANILVLPMFVYLLLSKKQFVLLINYIIIQVNFSVCIIITHQHQGKKRIFFFYFAPEGKRRKKKQALHIGGVRSPKA
jgi:hypothetical protein